MINSTGMAALRFLSLNSRKHSNQNNFQMVRIGVLWRETGGGFFTSLAVTRTGGCCKLVNKHGCSINVQIAAVWSDLDDSSSFKEEQRTALKVFFSTPDWLWQELKKKYCGALQLTSYQTSPLTPFGCVMLLPTVCLLWMWQIHPVVLGRQLI